MDEKKEYWHKRLHEALDEMHEVVHDLIAMREILWQLPANVSGLRKDNPRKAVAQMEDTISVECHYLDTMRDKLGDARCFVEKALDRYEMSGEDWWREM